MRPVDKRVALVPVSEVTPGVTPAQAAVMIDRTSNMTTGNPMVTSLQQAFRVKEKSLSSRSFLGKCGITYFYYRYRLYEDATFPWKTWENLWAFTCALSAFIMFCSLPGYTQTCNSAERLCDIGAVPYLLSINSLITFTFSTCCQQY